MDRADKSMKTPVSLICVIPSVGCAADICERMIGPAAALVTTLTPLMPEKSTALAAAHMALTAYQSAADYRNRHSKVPRSEFE